MRAEIERLYGLTREALLASPEAPGVFAAFVEALESGEVRAARPEGGRWVVDTTVKKGILVGFRLGHVVELDGGALPFSDKHTWPVQRPPLVERNIRIVPGGSSVRRGAYLGRDVTCMPPCYVNVGAWVGDGTMVDSHALVGSCAQIGRRVHLSAGVQIGGVLEPIGQSPVIIEDDVMVGGNSGIYEGCVVREGAVIGTGTLLNASTPVYDVVHGRVLRGSAESPLEIPAGAVVVPGSRPAKGEFAAAHGLHIYTPLIVKYRDGQTDARTALEEALR